MARILAPRTLIMLRGKTFCHFIAESRKLELMGTLSKAKFLSVLMDGSIDDGKVDDELYL